MQSAIIDMEPSSNTTSMTNTPSASEREGAQSRLNYHSSSCTPQSSSRHFTAALRDDGAHGETPATATEGTTQQNQNSITPPRSNTAMLIAALRRLQEDPSSAPRLLAVQATNLARLESLSPPIASVKRHRGEDGDDKDDTNTEKKAKYEQ